MPRLEIRLEQDFASTNIKVVLKGIFFKVDHPGLAEIPAPVGSQEVMSSDMTKMK